MAANLVLPIGMIIFIFLIWIFKCLNIMREYERAVVFRLGRVLKEDKGPGIVLILWPIPDDLPLVWPLLYAHRLSGFARRDTGTRFGLRRAAGQCVRSRRGFYRSSA